MSNKVQGFLDELHINYILHADVTSAKPLNFSAFARSISACPVKAVLFADDRGPIVASFNAENGLDFDALSRVTGRKLSLDPGHRYKTLLHGFSIRHLPPLAQLYQMPMVIDEGLLDQDRYLLEVGGDGSFIEIDKQGFKKLIQGAQKKSFVKSVPVHRVPESNGSKLDSAPAQAAPSQQETKTPPARSYLLGLNEINERFKNGVNLPVMPTVAEQLITMKSEDDFELLDLVHLIESDPVVSAKIISYANSPFFSYEGKLQTIQEAIYHVLGVDISLNIALALALGRQFEGPMKGVLGAASVWRHAVYCGVLSQSIATNISNRDGLKPGTAYLFGLLHNIGYLALGHLYTEQFSAFNKMVSMKKDIPLSKFEKSILGVTHTGVGALLMKAWNMPPQYTVLIENHHKGDYRGDYEEYVNIVYLANLLLKSVGIGDANEEDIPQALLAKYNLDEAELSNMLNIVMGWHENLDHLAHQLAA